MKTYVLIELFQIPEHIRGGEQGYNKSLHLETRLTSNGLATPQYTIRFGTSAPVELSRSYAGNARLWHVC